MTSKSVLSSMRICYSVSKTKMQNHTWNTYKYRIQTYIICSLLSPWRTKTEAWNNLFFGGLECVGHSFAYCMSPIYDLWGISGVEPKDLDVTSRCAITLDSSLSNLATHMIHCMSLFCFSFVGGYWLVMYIDFLKDYIVRNYPQIHRYLTTFIVI